MMAKKDGLVVIYKEAGWTSFDVVAKMRRILGTRRVGHTGTLDPAATGVLPVVFGRGTALAELLSEHDKTYQVVCRLGIVTDTQDMTGTVLETHPVQVSQTKILEAAGSFLGERLQVPPMYSALKVDGKKLYELAREGTYVERKPRPVTFHEIKVLSVELPRITLEVSCSKGTYIRTFCDDLGRKLGCGGCMESLLRTRSGTFTLGQAVTVGEAMELAEEGRLDEVILGLDQLLSQYPRYVCSPQEDKYVLNGNKLRTLGEPVHGEEGLVRMCSSNGELVGLYRFLEVERVYAPVKMLLPS